MLMESLQGCQVLPASTGRPPEVSAAIAEQRLSREVEVLLPLAADGAAALTDMHLTRQHALQAMLKVGACRLHKHAAGVSDCLTDVAIRHSEAAWKGAR